MRSYYKKNTRYITEKKPTLLCKFQKQKAKTNTQKLNLLIKIKFKFILKDNNVESSMILLSIQMKDAHSVMNIGTNFVPRTTGGSNK